MANDLIETIHVEAVRDGAFRLTWSEAFSRRPVSVFANPNEAVFDMAEPCIVDAESGVEIAGFAAHLRPYFRLLNAAGDAISTATRAVSIEGAVNFRDLGGYASEDGRRVQWGRLFRSGHLSGLSAAGLRAFAALNIQAVCDFRQSEERAREDMRLPGKIQFESLEIPPGVGDAQFFHRLFASSQDPQAIVDGVHQVVRSMVDESAARYRRLFEVLLEPHERNILINCSAGKERTGVGAALILSALGVPRETIYYDFMLSRDYFPAEREIPRVLAKYEVRGATARDRVMPLLETRRSYLAAAFDFIDDNYGDVLNFLERCYGLGAHERRALRDRYTE